MHIERMRVYALSFSGCGISTTKHHGEINNLAFQTKNITSNHI